MKQDTDKTRAALEAMKADAAKQAAAAPADKSGTDKADPKVKAGSTQDAKNAKDAKVAKP
jgi:hypothetical protein